LVFENLEYVGIIVQTIISWYQKQMTTANLTGNPRVTPEVTREVCLLARMMATDLYFARIEDLMFEVKHCPFPT